jgi:methylthioribose-1-phosphate isomerase
VPCPILKAGRPERSYHQGVMTDRSVPEFEGELAPVVYRDRGVDLLDQNELPERTVVLRLTTIEEVAEAIRTMRVRGAPAIGIAAAYGMVLAGESTGASLERAGRTLRSTRPTAVNLGWAVDRMLGVFEKLGGRSAEDVRQALLTEARRLHAEAIEANRKIGRNGADLLPEEARVLTICHTGALATGGYGTAYGVLRAAHEAGRLALVYACETRPRLQGARLTAWELLRDGIPFRLLSDGAAAYLMSRGEVDAILAGADRIASNGDTANKIGTYALAVAAKHHGIPMYVVAPTSTIDPATPSGASIPIEERAEDEVLSLRGVRLAPEGARAWNPAFDVTPAELITAVVTEAGVHRPPVDFRREAIE